jgi:hypothetical protein
MSDTIEKLKREIADSQIILKEWKIEAEKLKADKITFEGLQKKAKDSAVGKKDADRYKRLVDDYQSLSKQLIEIQEKITKLDSDITTKIAQLEKEMVMEGIIEVASLQIEERTYQFKMYDSDVLFDDTLSTCTINIKFWQILYKPTGKKIWYPKYVDIDGSNQPSFAIGPSLVRVAVRGTDTEVAASIDINIDIVGQPKTVESTWSVGAERSSGVEAKANIAGGEIGASQSTGFSLSYTKSTSSSFNGGKVVCKFKLEYNCMGTKPIVTKKSIYLPTATELEAIEADSQYWTDGNLDLYLKQESDNL